MNEFSILVLIDWSNVFKRPIEEIVGSVLPKIEPIRKCAKGRCEVRLYGGWDEDGVRSKDAQSVLMQVANWGMDQLNICSQHDIARKLVPIVIPKPELAETLLADSTYRFERTYRRKRPASGNIRVAKPVDIGCHKPGDDCFLRRVDLFLNKQKECPGCSQRPAFLYHEPLCYRNEQKMVDVMLSCDIAHAVLTYDCVILVSEDDDFVPILRQVSIRDCKCRVVRATPRPKPGNHRLPLHWESLEEIEV